MGDLDNSACGQGMVLFIAEMVCLENCAYYASSHLRVLEVNEWKRHYN